MIKQTQLFLNSELKIRLLQILGMLYIIDGVSLLLRGFVGGLFLLHETSSVIFIVIYISHVYLGGALYTYFGYGLISSKYWAEKIPGFLLAVSSIIWAVPGFGADYFTAILGMSYIIIMTIWKPKK